VSTGIMTALLETCDSERVLRERAIGLTDVTSEVTGISFLSDEPLLVACKDHVMTFRDRIVWRAGRHSRLVTYEELVRRYATSVSVATRAHIARVLHAHPVAVRDLANLSGDVEVTDERCKAITALLHEYRHDTNRGRGTIISYLQGLPSD
jgi:hypothetical protein